MKIEWIYRWIPVPVFYTAWMVSKAGNSFGFFVFIKPQYKYARALIEHELVHCRQFYRTGFLHVLLYRFSRKYRYRAEFEAYAKMIEVLGYTDPAQAFWIVDSLYGGYRLGLQKSVIEADVKKILERES